MSLAPDQEARQLGSVSLKSKEILSRMVLLLASVLISVLVIQAYARSTPGQGATFIITLPGGSSTVVS
jgi:hypothetical protein